MDNNELGKWTIYEVGFGQVQEWEKWAVMKVVMSKYNRGISYRGQGKNWVLFG